MHRIFVTFLCLTGLVACGGSNTDFADRFAIDGSPTSQSASSAAATEETQLVQETDATRIVLVGGTPRPANRQFPRGVDTNALRNFTAPDSTFDPVDTTATGPGGSVVNGSASYSGTYAVDKFENIDDRDTTRWIITKAEGPIVVDVNLDSGQISGRSSDNRLLIGRAATPINGGIVDGAVEFDGIVGPFNGTVTSTDIQADFAGETGDTGYLGRFQAAAP